MGLQVGKIIYDILSSDTSVSERVGNKIFPLVSENGTTFPFIVYKRIGILPFTTKDKFIHRSEATVDVIIASDKYYDSIEIADLVLSALSGKKGEYSGQTVKDIIFSDASEDFVDDTFIQSLTFKIIN